MIKTFVPLLLLFFFATSTPSMAQGNFSLPKNKSSRINFKLVNNLIIVPIELNGVKLSFVLDTGVSKPILFNIVNTDSLKINNVETIFLQGLGGNGTIEALRSRRNVLKLGKAICDNQDVYVVFDSGINFTPRLGIPVHGIIGYDVFKDFIVELNYSKEFIRLHNPETFKGKNPKKWTTVPINLHKRKPYVNAKVKIDNAIQDVKLLIDTGGSDSAWLFEDEEQGITYPDSLYFEDFLGKGLSGAVYGKRSKLESFDLAGFIIKDVNVAYPDSAALSIARNYKSRNGSVGGNILKRFDFVFDYKSKKIQIKKNKNFNLPFYYNNAGIVLEQKGQRLVREKFKSRGVGSYSGSENDMISNINISINYRYVLIPAYEITELRDSSNAKAAGLRLGDIIVSINNKELHELSLQQVNKYFYDKEGTTILIKVERDGALKTFRFKLDNVFKKKSPQIEGSN